MFMLALTVTALSPWTRSFDNHLLTWLSKHVEWLLEQAHI